MTQTVADFHERHLPLEGVHNFRDYGGYATAGGGRLRSGWLYRSGQHVGATAADLERIAGLNLAAVIDMRSDREREVAPCARPEGFGARVLFVGDREVEAAPHIAAADKVNDPDTAARRMVESYAGMAFRPAFRKVINHYFTALAEADGPVLIHCMAGKDRTGMAVALLHRALGVAREDWLADYLLTNITGNVEARIAAGAVHVREAFGRELDDATVRVLMTVRPEFIDSGLAAIDAQHGGVASYLASCGIDAALLSRLRERLIV
jgi:protein tyrosine/serine phosphatase